MASKITIKRSLTAAPPAGLSFGEMAFVQGSGLTANQLYVGISGGNPVWVGAQIGTTGTWTDNSAKTSLATQYATDQRITTQISANTSGVASVNGLTGAVIDVALTTNPLSQFAATTSSQLLGVISDETGTGSLVFASSPTLVTPALGTPSALVGTNITGTATAFTASNVTTNANLTGHITSTGNAAVLGAFSSAQLATALTDETGSGAAVFATSPTMSGVTLGASTATTINNVAFIRPASTATLELYTGSTFKSRGTFTSILEFTGSTDVTFPTSGTLSTLAGVETLSNKTLSGVTLGTPLSGTLTNCTGLPVATGISGLGSGIGTFLATPSSTNLISAVTDETGSGALVFANTPTLVTPNIGAATGTSLVLSGDLTVNGTTTTINSTTLTIDDINIELGSGVTYTNATANGGGITLKGTTDKTIIWDSANDNWTSSENWNIPTGKVFKINNASVLSATTLGSAIVTSSLTTVGTITSGTWNSSFAAGIIVNADINASAGIVDTKLATISTASKVSNSATTATNANTASAIVARDGSGNFTAGTITADLTGTARTATNITVASETSDTTCFIAFVTASSGDLPTKVNSTLTYNAASGELSATLIDGGTF